MLCDPLGHYSVTLILYVQYQRLNLNTTLFQVLHYLQSLHNNFIIAFKYHLKYFLLSINLNKKVLKY